MSIDQTIERNLRRSIEVAKSAREKGNHPFGAVLADENGEVLLEAENNVVTERDITGHAETNLVREASKDYNQEDLLKCTLYASTEPCPMCAGAIYWSGIGRVVFGLSQKSLYQGVLGGDEGEGFLLTCAQVFARGDREIVVIGPLLEDEASLVHQGFWDEDDRGES
jgi:tRNA(Arg) A34 adenosine deaminase TadA